MVYCMHLVGQLATKCMLWLHHIVLAAQKALRLDAALVCLHIVIGQLQQVALSLTCITTGLTTLDLANQTSEEDKSIVW